MNISKFLGFAQYSSSLFTIVKRNPHAMAADPTESTGQRLHHCTVEDDQTSSEQTKLNLHERLIARKINPRPKKSCSEGHHHRAANSIFSGSIEIK
jgi:hypothetical protein